MNTFNIYRVTMIALKAVKCVKCYEWERQVPSNAVISVKCVK